MYLISILIIVGDYHSMDMEKTHKFYGNNDNKLDINEYYLLANISI